MILIPIKYTQQALWFDNGIVEYIDGCDNYISPVYNVFIFLLESTPFAHFSLPF